MANELKPCPFCGAAAEMQPWHGGAPTKQLISCSDDQCDVGPSVTGETPEEAATRWNTRPAAPVEGLETVAWTNAAQLGFLKDEKWKVVPMAMWAKEYVASSTDDIKLVTRSQAEAIIAERDAEIDRLKKINAMIMGDDENAPRYTTKRLKQEVERVTQVMRGEAADREAHVKTLQADNSALTARVARDDAAFQELIKLGKEADTKFEALEIQLAAARKALADIASHDMICLKDPYRTILQDMINTARAALEDRP
ncbi:hypothetical protein Brsp05_02784 [Brucella sp. NBRC 12953]|uniref:Lar family restriction alleviation protein n=1 Tax=Brucella sp. NBRC 12953 TaxID=3075481 RepID=UPI00309A904D